MLSAQAATTTVTQIVADEIQQRVFRQENRRPKVKNSVAERLRKMEGIMNLHDIHVPNFDHTMAALWEQIDNVLAETIRIKLEKINHLQTQFLNMHFTSGSAAREVTKIMVVVGLPSVQSGQWLKDNLKTLTRATRIPKACYFQIPFHVRE